MGSTFGSGGDGQGPNGALQLQALQRLRARGTPLLGNPLPKWRLFNWENPLETGKSMKIIQLSIFMLLYNFIYS